MNSKFDFAIVGAGIAGASAAYFLGRLGRVLILERESQPGYHSTGRSAALYSEAYGNETIRALTTGGKEFFLHPPTGFTEHDILTPRGAMFIGRADQLETLDEIAVEAGQLVDTVRRIDAAAAREVIPALKPDYVAGGVLEPNAMDIDVDVLHQGFLRGAREQGAELLVRAEVKSLSRVRDIWSIETSAGDFEAGIVVNCAGAWCDQLAALAGARQVGLVPKRRTAIHFKPGADMDIDKWPLCVDADEEFYFKPDAGKLIGSPADETPVEPQDIQPEELDIAIAADRIETATDMKVGRIEHRWAGLRSFVADKTLVVGLDPNIEGFFWVAGQGGYGIQTSPSVGRLVAALINGEGVPGDLEKLGVTASALDPARYNGDTEA
jgi:D-arginine dehydrogenase